MPTVPRCLFRDLARPGSHQHRGFFYRWRRLGIALPPHDTPQRNTADGSQQGPATVGPQPYGLKNLRKPKAVRYEVGFTGADIIALRSFDRVHTPGKKEDLAERIKASPPTA
jgi:hypothetical protein